VRKLTAMQKKYVELVVTGKSPEEAVHLVGYKSPEKTVSKLNHHALIQLAIRQGRKKFSADDDYGKKQDSLPAEDSFVGLSLETKKDVLAFVRVFITNVSTNSALKIKGLDMLNRLMGNYEHEKDTSVHVKFFYPDKPEASQEIRDDFGDPPPVLPFPEYSDDLLD